MVGSVLQELLELVYAKNAVIHMLSGKELSRAVLLTVHSLNAILPAKTFNVLLPVKKNTEEPDTAESEQVSPVCSALTDVGLASQSATIVQV